MTDNKTRSWIFLATAMASKTAPADIDSISNVADWINHAVPTDDELQTSLSWLILQGLITERRGKYGLTEKSELEYKQSSGKTSVVFKIWDNLDRIIDRYQSGG